MQLTIIIETAGDIYPIGHPRIARLQSFGFQSEPWLMWTHQNGQEVEVPAAMFPAARKEENQDFVTVEELVDYLIAHNARLMPDGIIYS